MRVLVTGASGFIGSALMPALRDAGHEAIAFVRSPTTDNVEWHPDSFRPKESAIEFFASMDAVVNLAGENIAGGRWTAERKQRIRISRGPRTEILAATIAALPPRPQPRVMVSASAVGIYGDTGDKVVTEAQPPGSGFLAEVGREWEDATRRAQDAGVRVVLLRMGMVLGSQGGALAKMLPPFRMGVGGRLGDGKQWMSWIALDDLVALILFALREDSLHGPVNAVAPNPITNADFTRALGEVLHRPSLFPVPAFVVRTVFGEMGRELLLASNRSVPQAALAAGFEFRYPEIRSALEHALNRSRSQ